MFLHITITNFGFTLLTPGPTFKFLKRDMWLRLNKIHFEYHVYFNIQR